MILDFHCSCGNYPRSGKNWSIEALTPWADLCSLEVLVVESADARICSAEWPEEALLEACAKSKGRFLPAATIRLESDIASIKRIASARRRGFCCVVLHGKLFEESRVLHEALTALAKAPLPLYRSLTSDEFDATYRLACRYPQISFVIAPISFDALELNHKLSGLRNVYLSAANTIFSVGQVETACRVMGAEHILFASDMPSLHPGRPLGAILDAEISESDRRMILGGSAIKLLAAHGIKIQPRNDHPGWDAPPPCSIIDAHGHIGTYWMRPDFDSSAQAVIRYLDRAGAEVIYVSDVEAIFGSDVIAGNQRTANCIARFPDRIRGYIVINPWMGKACFENIRYWHARGFCGLKPYPGTFGHQISDPIMDPIWDISDELKLPILCHTDCGDISRLLEKRPNARMIMAHMTSDWKTKAEIARAFPGPNLTVEISGAGCGLEDIVKAIEIAGPTRFIFGSDLNCHALNFTLRPLMCSGLPEQTLRAILRDNALRYFSKS